MKTLTFLHVTCAFFAFSTIDLVCYGKDDSQTALSYNLVLKQEVQTFGTQFLGLVKDAAKKQQISLLLFFFHRYIPSTLIDCAYKQGNFNVLVKNNKKAMGQKYPIAKYKQTSCF
ncbi:hypothetical protein A9C19_05000 [Bacillus weihaiensis]|uniref:Uncharacterized protein n=1 Tax=Bacillus weihaiensis TaxID=1547283 RepID=A0A1L3MP60_9BACI|nr:hypothetical protein A9C19_05000 [Bacillus weihaiensis]